MKRKLLILSLFIYCTYVNAQNPSSSICNWKNDAAGTYSYIHDDYGDNSVIGINNYADTMARNRGLKFTFGAITSACEANAGMWTQATSMVNYGHEIINHTHNHTCAIYLDWCTDGLWAEPSTEDFATQMDLSTTLINTNTGKYPRYFIYPYDQYNSAANDHLKTLGFIGSRTGAYDAADNNNFVPDADGFFKSAVVVDAVTTGNITKAANLNTWVDYAISNNSWVNREMHNVGTSGWGYISVADYRNHLNYLKSKTNNYQLWVGTVSEVLTYQIQKLNYTPSTNYNANNQEINITWNTTSFNVANYLQPLQVKSPVTMKVFLDGLNGNFVITQNGQTLNQTRTVSNYLYFDAYPHNGPIKIKLQSCNIICVSKGINDTTTFKGNNLSFSFDAYSSNAITYQWYFNDIAINGKTTKNLSLINLQINQGGEYKIIAKSNGNSVADSAVLTVLNRGPFNGTPSIIPGTIEFEEYDNGGQNISYYDDSQGNEANVFRTEDVDIEDKVGGGYDVGWTTAGEWLEYTVDVSYTGTYTVEITHSSQSSLGKVKLWMDGVSVSTTLNLTKTNNYDTYKTTSFTNIALNSGVHILRIQVIAGDVNLDKIKFTNTSVSVNSIVNPEAISVYPNPSSNCFTIDFKNELVNKIVITNVEGKVIDELNNIYSPTISMGENLPQGVYFLQCFGEEKVIQKKLIKN